MLRFLRNNWLPVIGIPAAVIVGIVLDKHAKPSQTMAISAGLATAMVVLGFELLRKLEINGHRRRDYARLVDSVSDGSETDDLRVLIEQVWTVWSDLSPEEREDVADFVDAEVKAERSEIPFFFDTARKVFSDAAGP